MSGITLPPEQRSIMPGVNAFQDQERVLSGQKPFVDSALLQELMGAMMGSIAPLPKSPFAQSLSPQELEMYQKLPRSLRSFSAPQDYARKSEGTLEQALGTDLPSSFRPVTK